MSEWEANRGLYLLRGREVVPCTDLFQWAQEQERATTTHRVGCDEIGGVLVSTVFLGLDHNFSGGPPHLFETMTFSDDFGEIQLRCATYDHAERQHATVCRLVRARCNLATQSAEYALESLRELAKKGCHVLDPFYKLKSDDDFA